VACLVLVFCRVLDDCFPMVLGVVIIFVYKAPKFIGLVSSGALS